MSTNCCKSLYCTSLFLRFVVGFWPFGETTPTLVEWWMVETNKTKNPKYFLVGSKH
jgi:hypothetical protein